MIHREECSLLSGGSAKHLMQLQNGGPCFTLRVDGNVIACGGVVIPWAGLGELWVMTSPLMLPHRKTFHKTAKQLFERLKAMKLNRIQSTVSSLHPERDKCLDWAVRFGFRLDGTAWKYGPHGENHYRLVYFEEE